MKPNILIVGPSGSGKSSSLRNLDPSSTAVLNSEQKALPFKGGAKFTMNRAVPNMDTYWELFRKMMKGKKTKVIVNESLTSLFEHQMRESEKFFTGFDLWGNYAKEIEKILHESKNTDKYIVSIGIDGIIEGSSGIEERYFAVQGKWKKLVEKEFVIVLYTDCIVNENGDPEYKFITNKQKGYEKCSAKSPMGMFPPIMDNDLSKVIELIEEFYADEDEPVKKGKK